MTTTESPTLRVTGPAEPLGAVPYLLGFHPEESLVVIGLDDAKVIVSARIALTDVQIPGILPNLFDAIKRGAATRAVAAIFTDTITPSTALVASLVEQVERAGLELIDTLLVTGGRWWSVGCKDPVCCPPEGRPMPPAPTVLDAAATYAGLSALPSRDALASMFEPVPDPPDLSAEIAQQDGEQLSAILEGTRATYDRSATRALFAAQRAAQAGQLPTDSEVARYAVALQSYTVRDALWLALDDHRLEGLELWVNLARRLPSPYDAPPLFLAAWRAWRDGNGALAGIAAERALASDPGYSAADLLLAALARGIDPRTLPKLRLPAQSKGAAESDINA
jgi:Domain of unknown function (DUF4192)